MNKMDKSKIAQAWREYHIAASQCSNVLYNLSQSDPKSPTSAKYGELVRSHDAKRNTLVTILKRFGILAEG